MATNHAKQSGADWKQNQQFQFQQMICIQCYSLTFTVTPSSLNPESWQSFKTEPTNLLSRCDYWNYWLTWWQSPIFNPVIQAWYLSLAVSKQARLFTASFSISERPQGALAQSQFKLLKKSLNEPDEFLTYRLKSSSQGK